MARGVDFKGVQMVINYDLPQVRMIWNINKKYMEDTVRDARTEQKILVLLQHFEWKKWKQNVAYSIKFTSN